LLEGEGERRARLFFNKANSDFLENSDFLVELEIVDNVVKDRGVEWSTR